MLSVVALSAALVVNAAEVRPQAWVVVTKRTGVTRPAAIALARTLSESLANRGVANPTEVADLSTCNAKLPCLLDAAKKKKAGVLVIIEAATVLDDMVIHSEALDVVAEGSKVGAFDFEGPTADFAADVKKRVGDSFVPAIRKALGIDLPPPPTVPAPEPMVVAPTPKAETPTPSPKVEAATPKNEAPPAAVVVAPAPPTSSGMSTQKKIGLAVAAVGVVTVGIGAGMGATSLSKAGEKSTLCPAGKPCTNPAAYTAYDSARSSQTIATVLFVAGGVVAATGALLFFVDFGGGKNAQASAFVGPNGGGLSVQGSF